MWEARSARRPERLCETTGVAADKLLYRIPKLNRATLSHLAPNPHPRPLSQKGEGRVHLIFCSLSSWERVPKGRVRVAHWQCVTYFSSLQLRNLGLLIFVNYSDAVPLTRPPRPPSIGPPSPPMGARVGSQGRICHSITQSSLVASFVALSVEKAQAVAQVATRILFSLSWWPRWTLSEPRKFCQASPYQARSYQQDQAVRFWGGRGGSSWNATAVLA